MDLEVFAAEAQNEQDASAIIGKFGVGFYSAFMVASKVTVESKSYSDAVNAVWSSADGAEVTFTGRRLEDDAGHARRSRPEGGREEYLQPARPREVVQKKYSFPIEIVRARRGSLFAAIEIDGELANTTGAVRGQDPREVDEKTYESFIGRPSRAPLGCADVYVAFPARMPPDIKCCSCRPFILKKEDWEGWSCPSVSTSEESGPSRTSVTSRPSGAAS